MLDHSQILHAAAQLDRAERSREQVRQFSLDYPGITIDDAYAIQRSWVEQKIRDGRKLVGHKIGLTSRAMQVSSNITEPDYGALLDDMFFDEGTDIPFERFIVPRVEVELAQAIGASGAQRVIVTHGSVPVLVRYLNEQGLQAEAFDTEYGDEHEAQAEAAP